MSSARYAYDMLAEAEVKPDLLAVTREEVIGRHSSSATTLELYTQSPMEQRIAAQEQVLNAILEQPTTRRPN